MQNLREEHDTMGTVMVPADRLWGAQTQRSLQNFAIGQETMPRPIIRAFADTGAVKEEGTERVTLYRDDKHLYINGVRFPMRRLQRGEEQQLWLGNLSVTDRDYETELDAAATSIDRLVRDLSDNLFVSEEDKKSVAQYVSIVRKEIAWARVDMRKLRYGDE